MTEPLPNIFSPTRTRDLPCVTKSDGRAFLYIMEVSGKFNFTGYGVTTNPRKRASSHNYHLKRKGSRVADSNWVEMDLRGALIIEKAIKKQFPYFGQPIISFRSEATRLELYDNVITFVLESLKRRTQLALSLSQ